MLYNEAKDQMYVQAYGKEVRDAVWRAGAQRRAARTSPASHNPITDGVGIPSVNDALHALFMATARYHLDRASRGLPMPREISTQLLAMHGTLDSLCDDNDRMAVLNDALVLFVHSVASVEDTAVRKAIKAAQLSLKSLQNTWAEMPATTAEWRSESWLYD